MRTCVVLLTLGLCVMVTGCAVYSKQEYGPQNLGGVNTLAECLRKAGGPDVVSTSGTETTYIYRTVEGFQILGLFGKVTKKDRVIVFDATGKQIKDELVNKGEGLFVIGAMSPVYEME